MSAQLCKATDRRVTAQCHHTVGFTDLGKRLWNSTCDTAWSLWALAVHAARVEGTQQGSVATAGMEGVLAAPQERGSSSAAFLQLQCVRIGQNRLILG